MGKEEIGINYIKKLKERIDGIVDIQRAHKLPSKSVIVVRMD